MKQVYARHGDVHLIWSEIKGGSSIEISIPDGGAEEDTTDVEKGELTGHAHRLMFRHGEGGGALKTATIIKGLDGLRRLRVSDPTDLSHEEHYTRTIPPGECEIRRTRETDHMGGVTRKVAD